MAYICKCECVCFRPHLYLRWAVLWVVGWAGAEAGAEAGAGAGAGLVRQSAETLVSREDHSSGGGGGRNTPPGLTAGHHTHTYTHPHTHTRTQSDTIFNTPAVVI